jgi:hypothetical protein
MNALPRRRARLLLLVIVGIAISSSAHVVRATILAPAERVVNGHTYVWKAGHWVRFVPMVVPTCPPSLVENEGTMTNVRIDHNTSTIPGSKIVCNRGRLKNVRIDHNRIPTRASFQGIRIHAVSPGVDQTSCLAEIVDDVGGLPAAEAREVAFDDAHTFEECRRP